MCESGMTKVHAASRRSTSVDSARTGFRTKRASEVVAEEGLRRDKSQAFRECQSYPRQTLGPDEVRHVNDVAAGQHEGKDAGVLPNGKPLAFIFGAATAGCSIRWVHLHSHCCVSGRVDLVAANQHAARGRRLAGMPATDWKSRLPASLNSI